MSGYDVVRANMPMPINATPKKSGPKKSGPENFGPDLCDAPQAVTKRPKNTLPAGACDCHFHIFDAPSQQVAARSYTAARASLADYKHLQHILGIERSVIVQPSIYGSDNQTTLSVCQSDPHMKAVIVVDEAISDASLRAYADADVVGCRVNLLFSSGVDSGQLKEFAYRIADYGWHLQILADISQFEALGSVIPDLPVPVMFDHMGHMPTSLGIAHPAFQRFLSLLSAGQLWVKLSGAYRISGQTDCRYDDVAEYVSALVAANPDQLVWGTDWPHPKFAGPMPNDTDLLDQFFDWVPNSAHQQAIFVDNPASFYRF